MINRCYYLTKDHRLFIREKEMPVPAEGEVIIQPMANSICGSDIRMYTLAHMGKSYIREDALMNIYEFNWKELNYYGAVDYAGEFPTAVQWLADGRIDGAAMITKRFAFEELGEAFRYTADNPKKCIKTVIMHDA